MDVLYENGEAKQDIRSIQHTAIQHIDNGVLDATSISCHSAGKYLKKEIAQYTYTRYKKLSRPITSVGKGPNKRNTNCRML